MIDTKSSDTLLYEIKKYGQTSSAVANITFNRPSKGNALSPEMSECFINALNDIETQVEKVRALVITGNGKYFCSGMDMGSSIATMGPESDDKQVEQFQRIFTKLARISVPTICLLNGPALGGGVGIAFCCDLRLSLSGDFYFQLSESKRGLVPALISPWIVREMGKGLAMELMLCAGRISTKRLYQLGIINSYLGEYPNTQDSSSTTTSFQTKEEMLTYYLDMIISSAPGAIKTIKDLVLRLRVEGDEKEWQKDLKYTRETFRKMISTEEASYGMMCYLQRKKPNWESRL